MVIQSLMEAIGSAPIYLGLYLTLSFREKILHPKMNQGLQVSQRLLAKSIYVCARETLPLSLKLALYALCDLHVIDVHLQPLQNLQIQNLCFVEFEVVQLCFGSLFL